MRHLRFRAALPIVGLLLLPGCSSSPAAPSPAPTPAATRDGRFVQDIDALALDLPRLHTNLFFKTTRDTFNREVETLKTRVAEMKDHEVVAGLMRLAALPGDAHTSISPFNYAGFRRLPLRVRFVSDGLMVWATSAGASALLGGRVTRIGDMEVTAAIERIVPVVSRDNEAWLRAIGPNYLIIPEVLHAQGVVANPDQVAWSVTGVDGTSVRVEISAVAAGQEGTLRDALTGPVPLYRQRTSENYWYTWVEPDVVYLQYNRCQDAPADPMSSFSARVFADIDRRVPRAVIIDLRGNGGGNSSVADPLFAGLRSRRFLSDSGRLFALIGSGTFSSALLNSITLKRELGAILVGEPTGGRPNGYGEVRTFNLPNSGLQVSYSTKFFRSWPEGDPESLFPDIAAAISSTDYRDGRDPVLDAVFVRLGLTKTGPS
jgi:hypothetical protein